MTNPAVIPIKQIQLNQKHVPLIVSYASFDQKEALTNQFPVQLKLDNVRIKDLQNFILNI